jgi:MtaA/CmuA family methyltransferase
MADEAQDRHPREADAPESTLTPVNAPSRPSRLTGRTMTTLNGRDRVLAHLAGKPVDHLPLMPITMMFAAEQAGVTYGDYARDHRVLARAQVHTAEQFGFDYVSVISDPAREAADCGARVEYFPDQPPAIIETEARLADKAELARLRIPDPLGGGRMTDRVQGVALLRERVRGDRLVEGWVEGPCAEAADLRGINTLMTDFFDDPKFVRDLFEFVVQMELRFARPQIEAGIDLMGVGDAAASLVGPEIYEEFVWPYEKRLVDGLHALGTRVRLHICGNTRRILAGMGRLGCEIVDLDYPSSLAEGRTAMGPDQVLLGNLNPVKVLKDGSPDAVTAAVRECHQQAGNRYIVGAGCEVPRGTPLPNVESLAAYARTHQP